MSSLAGKVAVVTGGNSGIGLATARTFHANGAKVVITGRDRETLEEVARELGHDVLVVQADVMKLSEIDQLMARATGGTSEGPIVALTLPRGMMKSSLKSSNLRCRT